MMLAPNALPDDGLLDVVLTDRATRLDVLRELPRIQRGGYLKNPKVSWTRARTVVIEPWKGAPERGTTSPDNPPPAEGGTTSSLAIDIDGEAAGYTPAQLTILHRVVRFSG
jgi:diacylglycerol kinase family enzyme